MKRVILILAILIYGVFQTQAQEQEQQPTIKYAVSIESGFNAGLNHFGLEHTVVNGFRINNKHVVGFGIGIGTNFSDPVVYCPISANYRYYFNTKDFSPHVNIALGGMMTEDGGGIYSTLTAGFRHHRFTFSSGVFFQAYQYEEYYYDVWYAPHKTKTINAFPWGFVAKLGVAF